MALVHIGGPTLLLLAGVLVAWFYALTLGLIIIGVAIFAFIAVFLMGLAVMSSDSRQQVNRGY